MPALRHGADSSPRLALMPHAALPTPPLVAPRAGTWAWPLVLAAVFVVAIAAWSQWTMQADVEEERRTLLADALTVQSRLFDALNAEQQVIHNMAASLSNTAGAQDLMREQAVVDGLHRLWVSVTVLDAGNRVLAHVPGNMPYPSRPAWAGGLDDAGLTAHLVAPTRDGGRIIVRFAPSLLLRNAVPWWLATQYDARMVDGSGQRVAGPVWRGLLAGRQSHIVSLDPTLADTYLELTTRNVQVPWWRTLLPVIMALFLISSAVATITLRRRIMQVEAAEARWRTEVAWRSAIEDSLTVGLRARDLEGRTVHINRAFCDLVGLSPEQLLGSMPPMPYWPPDQAEQHMDRLRRNMSGGAPREGYVSRWVHSDGHPVDVMVFETPLVDARGRQTGWMGSFVDITERRKIEERERRQSELLANQARLITLGEVASALAHQLNQPLTAIAGYGAGVLRTLEGQGYDNERVLEALRRLGEQAVEAGRVVQRIRSFLTRRAPQREPCHIDDLVRRTLQLLARDLQRQGVQVWAEVDPGLPEVWADAVLIEQVLINLVRNAADALAETATPNPSVRIAATLAGERFVRVDVEDNGPGLAGRGIGQLTEAFYSTKPDGMGMGLAICLSVVEAHHGAMDAGTGTRLGGAKLSFTLPVPGSEPAPPDTASEETPR